MVKSLTSPEVRRIRRLWVNLPSRASQVLKELSLYVKNDNNYKIYNDALVQKIKDFQEVGQGMIVIPWMQPHYEDIKTITQSYSSGKSGDSSDVILSVPGARKLESIFSLLERCQTNISSDDDEEWSTGKGSPLTSRGGPHFVVEGATITLLTDLSFPGLGNGDLGLHHWIVSRVFLTKQQLIDESIEIEPLAENEQLPCVENDYEEEEEEEEDRASVGQYDLGSDDSGDNMGSTTLTTKIDVATGSTSQIIPHEISENPAKPEFTEMSSLTTKTESNETSSKSTVNPYNIPSFEESLKLHENTAKAYSIKPTEESITQVDSIKSEPTDTNIGSTSTTVIATKTEAIPIPQSSQRTTTPILSPANKNLNPHAPVFVPLTQSFSSSSSATVQGAIDKMNAMTKESTEMGETSSSRKSISSLSTGTGGNESNINNDGNDVFVYSGVDNENENENKSEEDENKSDDERFVYEGKDKDEDEDGFKFVYEPSDNASTSNNVKEEEEGKNNGLPDLSHQETGSDKDDGESKADSSFETNKKDTVTKSDENSSSPNVDVFTVRESSDRSITATFIGNAINKEP